MTDLLARKRLNENLLDQLEAAQRHIAQLERQMLVSDGDGRVAVAGILLEVLPAAPGRPPAGHVLVCAVDVAGVVEVQAVDAAGTVKTLESWV